MIRKRVEPVWLDVKIALAVHDRQLAEHGGGAGIRDEALLESALARPVNRWAYGEEEDLAALAAAYAFGIARNHPFVDGKQAHRLGLRAAVPRPERRQPPLCSRGRNSHHARARRRRS